MSKHSEVTYDRNFDTLLFDSIEMLFYSLDPNVDFDFRNTLARSSLINSILLLELSANICIESLELERSVFNEIDRLPILGKFDFYLRASFRNRKLIRGVKEVEGIKELKGLRDGYVHMKPHRLQWEIDGDGGTAKMDATKLLGICKNPKGWDVESAINAMRATHGFLRYYFKDLCKYGPTKVGCLLLSVSTVPGREPNPMPLLYRSTKKRLESMGVDLSYMKLVWV
jgi:hypothetical protein